MRKLHRFPGRASYQTPLEGWERLDRMLEAIAERTTLSCAALFRPLLKTKYYDAPRRGAP